MKKSLVSLSKIFSALASRSRLEMLVYIYGKQRRCKGGQLKCCYKTCIKELAKELNVTVPTVSHHIRELINAGLVTAEKKGKWVYCSVNTKAFGETACFLDKWSAGETK
jgi:ArsR family transcriptional regulator, arsenate/arsenite/antimonite-responsive transcriptional repressor